jgi:hypothetical protein
MLFAFSSGLLTPVSYETDMEKQNDVLYDVMECLKENRIWAHSGILSMNCVISNVFFLLLSVSEWIDFSKITKQISIRYGLVFCAVHSEVMHPFHRHFLHPHCHTAHVEADMSASSQSCPLFTSIASR